MRPWQAIPIEDLGEPLVDLPATLLRLEPHPYVQAGAPYGDGGSPFRLRSGCLQRLLLAQDLLQASTDGADLQFAIFDGWRPLAVQRFMVEEAIAATCGSRGIDPLKDSPEREAVVVEVGRFWAPPNDDPSKPPPHSTGAAVDLTLADRQGRMLAMGSPIDLIGPASEPDHFLTLAETHRDCLQRQDYLLWHRRRVLLHEAMGAAGFARHPNEWWHFSWGDQLWAWTTGVQKAAYGRWLGPP
jgi:D-alanyl-D-alanine dipeptidase